MKDEEDLPRKGANKLPEVLFGKGSKLSKPFRSKSTATPALVQLARPAALSIGRVPPKLFVDSPAQEIGGADIGLCENAEMGGVCGARPVWMDPCRQPHNDGNILFRQVTWGDD